MIVKWNRIVLADNHDGGRMDPRDHQLIILLYHLISRSVVMKNNVYFVDLGKNIQELF